MEAKEIIQKRIVSNLCIFCGKEVDTNKCKTTEYKKTTILVCKHHKIDEKN